MSKLSSASTWLAGVQWLFFMFANTVVIPISVGAAFHLSSGEITSALQRSFIYTGIACILQALWGHRLSLMEGQSGVWWGVILSLCASASVTHESLTEIGGALATGILLSGVTIAILGGLGMGNLLQKWFTPIVMSAFLILLACQLISIFFKGMMGLTQGSHIQLGVAALSLALVLLVCWLNLKGRGNLSNFSILIGIIVGWILYAFLFPHVAPNNATSSSLLSWFPWGKPNLNIGIAGSAFLTGMINTTNTVATLRGAETLYGRKTIDWQYRRSFIVTGLNTVVAGFLGMVPYAPYTSSIGFLRSTRIFDQAAFIVGGGLFTLLGIIPALGQFFSTMPISVGDAVLFVAYLQLFGAALQNLEGIRFNFRTIYRVAGPTLFGLALFNMPSEAFTTLPAAIRPLVSNGLLMGVLLAILLENGINWSQFEGNETANAARMNPIQK